MLIENKRIREEKGHDESAFKEILDQQETEYEEELKWAPLKHYSLYISRVSF